MLHATEVSFRLGPGTVEDARGIAARLSAAAAGCRDDMLFVDEQSGTFGYLALWDGFTEAEQFPTRPAVIEVVESLTQRLTKPPAVRQYTVERPRENR